MTDLHYTLRVMRRAPGFTLAAVATLALGIGANAAMFGVVNAVLLRPLPYGQPEALVQVLDEPVGRPADRGHAPANFLDLTREVHALSAMAGYRDDVYDLAEPGETPLRLTGTQATLAFFDVLQVPALVGRTWHAASDRAGDRLAVLGEKTWHRVFGGRLSVVGSTVRFNGEPATVIGVLPATFRWPGEMDVWMLTAREYPSSPVGEIRQDEFGGDGQSRGLRYFDVIGRLAPGATLAALRDELADVSQRLERTYPQNNRGLRFTAARLHDRVVGDVRRALWLLLGIVGLVLLIASANVTNLLLARAAARQREVGIRASLGATSWRLIRQMLTESVALALVGGAAGLIVARLTLSWLPLVMPESFPRGGEVDVDLRVFVVSLATTCLVGVLFGVAPALQAGRVDLREALQAGARTGTGGGTRRLRQVIVLGQVALALLVLAGAGLLGRSLLRLWRVDPGFRAAHVLTIQLPLPQARYRDEAQQARFYQDLVARVAAFPRVSSAAMAFPIPLGDGTGSSTTLQRDDRPIEPGRPRPTALISSISPGFFRTLGIPLRAGRDFGEADTADTPPVVIVSDALAAEIWPDDDPIGRRLLMGGPTPVTVVGVVGDIRRQGLDREPKPTAYLPYTQFTIPFMTLALRTADDPTTLTSDVRAAVVALDSVLPLGEVATLDAVASASVAEPRFRTMLVIGFAVLALALAIVGVYGVITYSVSQRVREMGIRAALGATPGDIRRLIVGEGLRLGAAGVAIGLAAGLASSRLLASQLFGVQPTDPLVFAGVAGLLLLLVVLASDLPARRAAGTAPLDALRRE